MDETGSRINISHIVLDANVFGKDALPDIRKIERYVEACRNHDVQLHIPQTVVWELAEHAIGRELKLMDEVKRHNKERLLWTAASIELPDPITPELIQASIEAVGAKVIPLAQSDAMWALQDQILQLGPGTRKDGTKTGASDSAAFRSVATHFDSAIDQVLVVTGDVKSVNSTFEILGVVPPQIAKSLKDIGGLFSEIVVADRSISDEFEVVANELYARGELLGNELIQDYLADFESELPMLPRGAWLQDNYWESDYGSFQFFGDKVRVDGAVKIDNWTKTVSANLIIEGDIQEVFGRQDFIGSEPEFVIYGIAARLTASIVLGYDGAHVIGEVWDSSFESSIYENSSADIIPN